MKPHPSRYNCAILKRLVVFLKDIQVFCIQLAHSKEEERLHGVGSLIESGWKLWRLGIGLWLANCHHPRKGHCRLPQDVLHAYWGKVEAFPLQQGRNKEEERLGCMGSFPKNGWKLWHS